MKYSFKKKIWKSSIISGYNAEEGYEITIYIDKYQYTVSGKFTNNALEKYNKFKTWNDEYLTSYLDFLELIKKALDDKSVSMDESSQFQSSLHGLIAHAIIIFWKLQNGNLAD